MFDMIIMFDMVNIELDALNRIVAILSNIPGGMDREPLYYEIGRALGIAKVAIGSRLSDEAKQAIDDAHIRVMAIGR